MNQDIEFMCKIYNTYDVDWMGDKINNNLTRHHIIKKEHGGENGISNYALLTESSHHFLHYLEINYHNEYTLINKLFLYLNKSLIPPTKEYYEEMNVILKNVKKQIKNKRRGR